MYFQKAKYALPIEYIMMYFRFNCFCFWVRCSTNYLQIERSREQSTFSCRLWSWSLSCAAAQVAQVPVRRCVGGMDTAIVIECSDTGSFWYRTSTEYATHLVIENCLRTKTNLQVKQLHHHMLEPNNSSTPVNVSQQSIADRRTVLQTGESSACKG